MDSFVRNLKPQRKGIMAQKRAKREPVPGAHLRQVEFTYESHDAKGVCLAGDFNDWSLTSLPMRKDTSDVWRVSVPLTPGHHEYRFIADGAWQNDHHASRTVPNEFGSCNCVVEV
ncbi:MAG: isoamylase early set domain-containing protein [Verrucomicrobia bacterium]|nr:isoamylase early set domain-containing protein [Verrucomicrobiota bacterium]